MRFLLTLALPFVFALAPAAAAEPTTKVEPVTPHLATVHYKRASVGDVNVFYREAGPIDAPVVLSTPTPEGL